MASVGHVAVGMAAARVYTSSRGLRWPAAALWSSLSLLPDIDVIGFAFGVRYADPWGHRGAAHSLTMALALGVTAGWVARWLKRPAFKTMLLASGVLASHGLL